MRKQKCLFMIILIHQAQASVPTSTPSFPLGAVEEAAEVAAAAEAAAAMATDPLLPRQAHTHRAKLQAVPIDLLQADPPTPTAAHTAASPAVAAAVVALAEQQPVLIPKPTAESVRSSILSQTRRTIVLSVTIFETYQARLFDQPICLPPA